MESRIFITGATGFIGSNLARRYVKDNYSVHVIVRKNSNTWRINDILQKLTIYEADVTELRGLRKAVQSAEPDYIYHCANAGVYGGRSVSDTELFKINVLGLVNLLDALEEIQYKGFVNFGSSSEYGIKDKPMSESDACEPMSAYAVSKLAATRYAAFAAHTKRKPIITLRVFSPFGPYDDHRRLIPKTIFDALSDQDIILSNPDSMRDYIYINDVVGLCMEVLNRCNDFSGQIYNLGSGTERSVQEAAEAILSNMNKKQSIQWERLHGPTWEAKKWEADMSKTKEYFAWQPEVSFEDGIMMTIKWFKENQKLYER